MNRSESMVFILVFTMVALMAGMTGFAGESGMKEDVSGGGAGRFFDAHVHFHACRKGELDKVAEWMKANDVQRIINHPLEQSRPKNEAEYERMLENYRQYADISCTVKRSIIGRDKRFAKAFIIRNADKLLFGSDSGWWTFRMGIPPEYAFIDELDLPADVDAKLLRENAWKLFPIKNIGGGGKLDGAGG